MNGKEAAQHILDEFTQNRPKMIAISASALSHERDEYLSIGFDAFIAKPFLSDQIYDCLASLLHIEYEYAEAEPRISLDISAVHIPGELLERMKAAAELYGTTELKSCLDEMEQLGDGGRQLAEHLRGYLQAYDMQAILKILAELGRSKTRTTTETQRT